MNDQATPWMRTTLRAPTLSLEAERDLLKRVNDGDQAALGSIMLSQFKVVFRIAKRYQHIELDLDDLVQEAFVGQMSAPSSAAASGSTRANLRHSTALDSVSESAGREFARSRPDAC